MSMAVQADLRVLLSIAKFHGDQRNGVRTILRFAIGTRSQIGSLRLDVIGGGNGGNGVNQ